MNVESASGSRRVIYLSSDPIGRELLRGEINDGAATETSVVYDALGRVSAATKTAGPTTLFDWRYRYDELGNLGELGDVIGGAGATMSFHTDDRDRVCRIGYGNGGLDGTTCNVVYDGAGNVVGEMAGTGVRKLSYFASGNVRRIIEGAAQANFRYDVFGSVQDLDLTGVDAADTRHDQHFGGLIEQRDQVSNGTVTTFISRKIPGPGGIVASRRGTGQNWIFQFGEMRGNRFFVDGNGTFVQSVDYQPYGDAKSSGVQPGSAQYTPLQWNHGDELAPFGMTHLGARLYDPVIGRF